MKSHRTTRSKPASGAESLKFFDNKYHKEFVNNAKSSLSKDFRDKSWIKYKSHIESKSDIANQKKLRQIDRMLPDAPTKKSGSRMRKRILDGWKWSV